MQSLVILGRQPALGLAELESLYGADVLKPAGTMAALLDIPAADVAFDRLGGAMKLAQVICVVDATDWRDIERQLDGVVDGLVSDMADSKVQLGLSAYGLRVNARQLLAAGLTLKKSIKRTGRSVRLVPNTEIELNTASVQHNNLTGPNGIELVLLRDRGRTIIARTLRVQDIDSYTLRDRGRPKRDARVGMLPPKLAQIIINLAAARTRPETGTVVLDPFCGTGVVLQEASLMGYDIYGSDLDPRMVEYTDANLLWLLDQRESPVNRPPEHANDDSWRYYRLETGDATSHTWSPTPNIVAGETYLGRPFTALPPPDVLTQTIHEANTIIRKFLQNIHGQIAAGTRLCLAVPAWQTRPDQFKHLPLLDQIGDMGYNRISFEHARAEDLIYYREDQVVARQLLILEKQ